MEATNQQLFLKNSVRLVLVVVDWEGSVLIPHSPDPDIDEGCSGGGGGGGGAGGGSDAYDRGFDCQAESIENTQIVSVSYFVLRDLSLFTNANKNINRRSDRMFDVNGFVANIGHGLGPLE